MLDKYIGDGVMAIFNAPDDHDDHATRAVRAAVAMVQHIQKLAATWSELGFPGMRIDVGVHTGPAVVVTIGSPRRLEFTAIGNTVIAAAQIGRRTSGRGQRSSSRHDVRGIPEAERQRLGVVADPVQPMFKGEHEALLLHASNSVAR